MENILILGMGITGTSVFDFLKDKSYKLYIYDEKSNYPDNSSYEVFKIEDIKRIDLAIKSPGIHPDNEVVKYLKKNNIEVISDLEYFSRLKDWKNVIAVSGTNGKTTSAVLLGEIFEKAGSTHVAGNIGLGVMDLIDIAELDDYIILECSSFQLEDTINFKPKVSILTNITPDHLDWHKDINNYVSAKFKIFKNQTAEDYMILNFEDPVLKAIDIENKNIYYFSSANEVVGCFIRDSKIIFKDKTGEERDLFDIKIVKVPGVHNLENILCCVLTALLMDIDLSIIIDTVKSFKGVEHRIEFVTEDEGVLYYNDSKGTNPDATIKAINALKENITLIAGGYNKNSDFHKMLSFGKDRVVNLVLMGETKDVIKSQAEELGYENIYLTDSIKEAVKISKALTKEGDKVLLSPACASWDMYSSYEERGRDFKKNVLSD